MGCKSYLPLRHRFPRPLAQRKRICRARVCCELRSRQRTGILCDRCVDAEPFQAIRIVVVVVGKTGEPVGRSLTRVIAITVALGACDVPLVSKPGGFPIELPDIATAVECTLPHSAGHGDRKRGRSTGAEVDDAAASIPVKR